MKLFKFEWDCGRQGNLRGMFLAEQSEIDGLMGQNIVFGEVLGKHSYIEGILEEEDLEEVELQTGDIDVLKRVFDLPQGGTIQGYNPLDYDWEEDDE